MSDKTPLTGRGGAGRGQGAKPKYDEAMLKIPIRLPVVYRDYLGRVGDASTRLRELIEWADQHTDDLVKDPGLFVPVARTSFTMTELHADTLAKIGNGNRQGGLRRIVATAIAKKM